MPMPMPIMTADGAHLHKINNPARQSKDGEIPMPIFKEAVGDTHLSPSQPIINHNHNNLAITNTQDLSNNLCIRQTKA